MVKKICVIGDSFVMGNNQYAGYVDKESDWCDIIKEKTNLTTYLDGQSSRDVQTVIDNWIKLIPKLNTDDYLIICIPTFHRTRLPLLKSDWFYYHTNKLDIINRFMGTNQYQKGNFNLEIFGNDLSFEVIKRMSSFQEMINGSNASILNYLDIIESLVKITPCSTFIFSWDVVEIKNEYIKDKTFLIEHVGGWDTMGMLWERSNGLFGYKDDTHWSFDYNKKFANYLLNNFFE